MKEAGTTLQGSKSKKDVADVVEHKKWSRKASVEDPK